MLLNVTVTKKLNFDTVPELQRAIKKVSSVSMAGACWCNPGTELLLRVMVEVNPISDRTVRWPIDLSTSSRLIWLAGCENYVCTCSTAGEYCRRMLKKPDFSPAQPWCAKTRHSAGKGAASEEPKASLWSARCDE